MSIARAVRNTNITVRNGTIIRILLQTIGFKYSSEVWPPVIIPSSHTACLSVRLIAFLSTCSGVSRISFRGGFKIFWKSGGICMARSAMQRVASPRVC